MDLTAIRQDFPILSHRVHGKHPLIYLDNAASTQRPLPVLAAMERTYRESYANVHRGIHSLSEQCSEQYEGARQSLARWIGAAHSEEVIFTGGTTAALNLIARSAGEAWLRPGDEIVLTEWEHHSNLVPWQQLAQRQQLKLKFSRLPPSHRFSWDDWCSQFTSRTKLFSATALSNVTGEPFPVAKMVALARERGVISVIDAAQWAPHEPLSVAEWGADFVAFSGHKMVGPTGVGVLYGRRDLLAALPPFLGGGSMINSVDLEGFTVGELPAKFEAGTPPIVEAIGLGAAADYLQGIGREAISQHELVLAQALVDQLQGVDGLQWLSPSPVTSGIATFAVERVAAQDLAVLLDRRGIAVRAGHHCAMPLHRAFQVPASVRVSCYLYNTLAEIEQTAEAIRQVITKLRP